MLKISRILCCFVCILIVTIACEIPSGLEGEQGPEGPQGPIGPAGEDGSMMYAGVGEPNEDIGDIGDYYLDQNTGELYGPKTSDGWGNPIIILMGENGADGEDGQDGEDGSQILSGDGPPDIFLGDTGDFYLDKANFDLYGPKSAPPPNGQLGSWGSPINIRGADGNANVTRYIFSGHDFSVDSYATVFISGVSNPEQNVWMVYLKLDDYAYHMPGWGVNGSSEYRVFHNGPDFVIDLQSGPGEAYDNIEIVRIEASNTEDMTKQKNSIIPDDLDISDYQSVADYFGFYR